MSPPHAKQVEDSLPCPLQLIRVPGRKLKTLPVVGEAMSPILNHELAADAALSPRSAGVSCTSGAPVAGNFVVLVEN